MPKKEQDSSMQLLKTSLREKQLERLYIFHGEEIFLLHYYLAQLRKILVDELTESFNFHKFTSENFDVRSFADAVENLPMMAEHTMVWIDEIDIFKLNEDDRTKLTDVISDIPDYCTVVFTYETTQWHPDKRLKVLWDAVNSNAIIVDFVKQDHRDLITWVTRHFAVEHKTITPDLCSYLIDITGGTMTALAGEISKIAAYSDTEGIKKSDIDAVTEPVLDAVAFQMTDLLSEGNYGAAFARLQQLLKMQQDPLKILGAVGAHFRKLSAARTLLDNGRNHTELMRLYPPMGDYPAKKIMQTAKRISVPFCEKAAQMILEADRNMKTSLDDSERLLEILILQLSQEARND